MKNLSHIPDLWYLSVPGAVQISKPRELRLLSSLHIAKELVAFLIAFIALGKLDVERVSTSNSTPRKVVVFILCSVGNNLKPRCKGEAL